MSVFTKIRGIIDDLFTLGIGDTAHGIKDDADGVAMVDNAGTTLVNARVARPQGTNANEHASTYLDTKERVTDLEFSFAGASAPAPGANTGKYGICHTSGLSYTAGQIYLDTGAALVAMPIYKGMVCSPRASFTGTVSMSEDDLYLAESGSAPFTWTRKGGESHEAGESMTVEVPFGWADIGSPVSSTTSVPDGARVLFSRVVVDTPFSGGVSPTLLVEVDGSGGDVTLQATSDNKITKAREYQVVDTISVPPTYGGPIRLTLGGTATAGAGRCLVQFVTPSS